MNPISKVGSLLHSEIVALYTGANVILAQLVILNVIHLTPDKIAAWVSIIGVTLGPIVRAQVTPTTNASPPPLATTVVHNNVNAAAGVDAEKIVEAITAESPPSV